MTFALLFSISCFILLIACGSMERITEVDMIEAGEMEDPLRSLDDTLTVQGLEGLCEYTVASCEVFDSWADAGIAEERLSDADTHGKDAGVILITITKRCVNDEKSLGWESIAANDFELVARSDLEKARASGSLILYFFAEGSHLQAPYWIDQPGTSELGRFWIPALHAGESVTYTLGYVLDETARAAAEAGTLLLFYTTNGMPSAIDEMLLLPVRR